MNKKKICLFALGATLMVPNVNALTEVATGSWATYGEGTLIDSSLIDKGYEKRAFIENSLYAADATEERGREKGFTGIGYFGEKGVTYYFNQYNEEGVKTHDSLIVGNPDATQPDLTLTEVTWDGDNSTWIGEGAEVWAVNYNGTGEDRLVAYAYNKLAMKRATDAGAELAQVEGARIEHKFQSEAMNLYDTLIYFPEDFVYCSAIRIVDITESLKQYGGNGQNVHDGYDLDAIYGYKILHIPVADVEYQANTAAAVGNMNLGCENSCQKVVMKVATQDLKDGNVVPFDIVAGEHYVIGNGEVYLDENGEVKVRYNFNTSYDLVKVNEEIVGIFKDYANMFEKGQLLENDQLNVDEGVTLDDEYAYIKLHFDIEIPSYLTEELEYVEEVTTTCELPEEKEEDKKECNKGKKECNKDKKDCHHKNKCDKDNKKQVKHNKNCSNHKRNNSWLKKLSNNKKQHKYHRGNKSGCNR